MGQKGDLHLCHFDAIQTGLDAGIGGGYLAGFALSGGANGRHSIDSIRIEDRASEHTDAFGELILPVREVLFHKFLLGVGHVVVEGGPRWDEADEPALHDGHGGRLRGAGGGSLRT